MMSKLAQLPLGIKLDDAVTFDNYITEDNSGLLTILRADIEPVVYLWGSSGSGKSHLLQAICLASVQAGKSIMYLPLGNEEQLNPAILEGIESTAVVCIDDLQAVAGDSAWEEALFHFYNRLREQGGHLRITATVSPAALPIRLADLASRLQWGVTFALQPLNDNDKRIALQVRARQRGFELPDDVANYLMKRFPRDMHSLFDLLDRLDVASLQAQRRLTIPFVKQWLE